MRLELENIGKISKADIDLQGITVIAGENNTGKSTIGKTLYSIFNAFYNVENRIETERINSVFKILGNIDFNGIIDDFSFKLLYNNIKKISEEICEKYRDLESDVDTISSYLLKSFNELSMKADNDNDVKIASQKISDVLKISQKKTIETLLENSFDNEFCGQICNMYSDVKSKVKLTIKNKIATVELENNRIIDFGDLIFLKTEAVYIDDPFILDNYDARFTHRKKARAISHRSALKQKLHSSDLQMNLFDEIITNEKLDEIYRKINTVCDGELLDDNSGYAYHIPGTSNYIDINNISTGLKTFVIIKNLLQNGEIGEKSTLILDEPEIHLHPEWQILFAEIIVLLQKEFDMTILINTHSPYFLEAIEVYSQKYSIDKKCKYYLAENAGNVSIIKDVTDNPESIYKKLARPFQTLENERFSDD